MNGHEPPEHSTTQDSAVIKLANRLPKSFQEILLGFGPLQRWQTYITDLPGMTPMLDKHGKKTPIFQKLLELRGIGKAESIFIKMKDGTRLHALYLPPPNNGKLTCFFHGNKGDLADNPADVDEPITMNGNTVYDRHYRLELLKECAKDGFGFLAFSLPGFHPSQGSPSEINFNSACDTFAGLIKTDPRFLQFRNNPENIAVCGESLGGAVAAIFARKLTELSIPPGVLSLIATFDSLIGMTRNAFPQFSMAELDEILTEKLDTVKTLKSLNPKRTCLHIVTVKGDSVIPRTNSHALLKGAELAGFTIAHHEIDGDHTTYAKPKVIDGKKSTLAARRTILLKEAAIYAVDHLDEHIDKRPHH